MNTKTHRYVLEIRFKSAHGSWLENAWLRYEPYSTDDLDEVRVWARQFKSSTHQTRIWDRTKKQNIK